jgi:hypothetical protein
MNKSNNSRGMVFCVGFIVLIFVSLALFWCRFFFKLAMFNVAGNPIAKVQPSGLVDKAIENAPYTKPSHITFGISSDEMMFAGLGMPDYFINNMPFEESVENYFYQSTDKKNKNGYAVYYDKGLRQFVYCDMYFDNSDNRWIKKIQYYVGPDGVSKEKDDKIGRFVKPIKIGSHYERMFYDEGLKQFFRLDIRGKRWSSRIGQDGKTTKEWIDGKIVVFMGKPLAEDTWRRPVGYYPVGHASYLQWMPPQKRRNKDDSEGKENRRRSIHWDPINVGIVDGLSKYMAVVDATGRIDLLDRSTLEFAGNNVGKLPVAPEFYGYYGSEDIQVNNLYGFDIITFTDPNSRKYKGMAVGTAARDINGVALAVYDAKGRLFGRTTFNLEMLRPGVMRVAWGPVFVISKFALESLQGLVFQAGSLVTEAFGPRSWGRSLFFMPDSFAAGRERIDMENYLEKYVILFFMLIPGMAIGILLAWRVSRDAKITGLPDSARMWWVIITIAFGLSAYITYRIVRPKIALVSCINCGKLRRPDMEECHHCRGSWETARSNGPSWRVIE